MNGWVNEWNVILSVIVINVGSICGIADTIDWCIEWSLNEWSIEWFTMGHCVTNKLRMWLKELWIKWVSYWVNDWVSTKLNGWMNDNHSVSVEKFECVIEWNIEKVIVVRFHKSKRSMKNKVICYTRSELWKLAIKNQDIFTILVLQSKNPKQHKTSNNIFPHCKVK